MDIKSIISRIVEKKLEKDSDDPCWDGYVQLGTKKKGGKEVPNCVPKESFDLSERVEVDHSRYMRSHGKKARGRSMWMFTSKDMGIPSEDEMVTVSGVLTTAAKEAAKKLGTKRVYVMEEIELDEDSKFKRMKKDPWTPDAPIPKEFYKNGKLVKSKKYYDWVDSFKKNEALDEDAYTALNEAKTDVYHKHMLKALGKSRLEKNHSFTSMIANNGDFIVRDGAGRVAGRIPKAEHDLKESTELTEEAHNDLNDAIIEFQKKLMRIVNKRPRDSKKFELDNEIRKEIQKIDKDLDDLRSGPLFKIRPGR